jgi:hypothetical protein
MAIFTGPLSKGAGLPAALGATDAAVLGATDAAVLGATDAAVLGAVLGAVVAAGVCEHAVTSSIEAIRPVRILLRDIHYSLASFFSTAGCGDGSVSSSCVSSYPGMGMGISAGRRRQRRRRRG